MCDKAHNYIVEVIGAPVRYIGTDPDGTFGPYALANQEF